MKLVSKIADMSCKKSKWNYCVSCNGLK